ncbi:hypothetical protein RABR111495_24665 [Rahnella bruchi]
MQIRSVLATIFYITFQFGNFTAVEISVLDKVCEVGFHYYHKD